MLQCAERLYLPSCLGGVDSVFFFCVFAVTLSQSGARVLVLTAVVQARKMPRCRDDLVFPSEEAPRLRNDLVSSSA